MSKKNYVRRSFSKKELQCPLTKKCEMNDVFMDKLQALRDEFDHPMIITSGFRSPEHNKAVGGSKNSRHLVGEAVDISTKGMSAIRKHKLLELAFAFGFNGIAQAKTYVHIDTRKTNSTWTY
ncbi:MAG: DUF882 domain-containing protein [Pseudobacteriovorax sp.]|nr:DUF882 domain-containing protein [Pseudobacteriovorax sp.]